jgi:hypothetical protein
MLVISKSDIDDDSGCIWEGLCDIAGIPKTDKDHSWNIRAFAQIEVTGAKVFRYNHEEDNEHS